MDGAAHAFGEALSKGDGAVADASRRGLVECLLQQGKDKDAMREVGPLLASHPGDVEPLYWSGLAALRCGDVERAARSPRGIIPSTNPRRRRSCGTRIFL